MKAKLINSLAEALEMDVTQIKDDDKFRDYENYSSLTELSVLAMLDSDFGIEIEMTEFDRYLTVKDLVRLANSRSSK
jgi:acyl carrier protein